MEQHAVPQDITGFKFKLVGDMTLVQFGELAGGLAVGWLFWSSPIHILIRLPLAVFFALLGVGLAFVPVEERPMHVWIFNFFKSIYRPTYYIWRKSNLDPLQTPPVVSGKMAATIGNSNVAPILEELPKTQGPWPYEASPSPSAPATQNGIPITQQKVADTTPLTPPLQANSTSQMNSTATVAPADAPMSPPPTVTDASMAPPSVSPPTPPAPAQPTTVEPTSINELMNARTQNGSAPNPDDKPMTIEELVRRREQMSMANDQKVASALSVAEKKVNDLTEQNKELLMQIDEIKNKLYGPEANADLGTLTNDLDHLMEKKNKLATEIATVRDELAGVRVAPLTNPNYIEPPFKRTVKPVTVAPRQAIVSLTSIPNVVNGLVLDSEAKPLEGAILIVKDGNGNSIRALRTNKVGQFIASTPLSNGQYSIEVEKANYVFDPRPVTLTGQLIEPLEIRARVMEETQS